MSTPLGVWRTESNTLMATAASVASVVAGALLAIGFRAFEGPGITGSRVGLVLGVLLVVLGAASWILSGKRAITVDPTARCIVIEQANLLGARTREIPFDDIVDVGIGRIGDKEGGSVLYHVAVTLRSGAEVALFKGFYDGQHSRPAMEARRRRLVENMGREA